MGEFLEIVFQLLTTETGNLTYHLVLAFSLAGALQGVIAQRLPDDASARRMSFGLSLLLLLRLGLFVFASLAWQGLFDVVSWLPLLDRALTVCSLVLLIWLWAFPQPTRLADAATLLLALVVITVALLAGVWWAGQEQSAYFNGNMIDFGADALALGLITIGLLLLVVRRPIAWAYGLGMLGILAVGHALHLVWPAVQGDYPGAVRLAQMAAFPLLLALPGRLMFGMVSDLPLRAEKTEPLPTDVHVLKAAFLLTTTESPELMAQTICQAVARSIGNLEVGFLIQEPDAEGQIAILGGYDARLDQVIGATRLAALMAPVTAAALRQGRILRLPASSSSPDLSSMAQQLNYPRAGALLVLPVDTDTQPAGATSIALVLLSPYTGRGWGTTEQSRILNIAQPLVRFLQREKQIVMYQAQLAHLKQEFETIRQDHVRVSSERSQLVESQKEMLTAYSTKRLDDVILNLGKDGDENVNELVARLAVENEELKEALQTMMQSPPRQGSEPDQQLRLVLEEVSMLRSALSETEARLHAAQDGPVKAALESAGQYESIASLVDDLRQPLSSISGYTDFLLGESMGILGTMQRRFMERIKVSVERLDRLVDDLHNTLEAEVNSTLEATICSVNEIFDRAISKVHAPLSAKQIALEVALPDGLPDLYLDRQALTTVIELLLQHAGMMTPAEGVIQLRGKLEASEGKEDYILIQVRDGGPAIAMDELPYVFSHGRQVEFTGQVKTDAVDLARVKLLVEKIGARIWVDSVPEQGSVFSLLLPIYQQTYARHAGNNGA